MLECVFCKKSSKNSRAHNNHVIRCANNPNRLTKALGKGRPRMKPLPLVGPPKPHPCEFCAKIFAEGSNARSNHVRRCRTNPNRKHESKTPEGLKRLSDLNYERVRNGTMWTEDQKIKQSAKMRQVARDNPDKYSNRRMSYSIIYNGIRFDSYWELDFYKWCIENEIKIQRNKQGFPYMFDGLRTYYPDFYLPDYNVFAEIKGRKKDRDLAKWLAFKHSLAIIEGNKIRDIRKKRFTMQDLFDLVKYPAY